MTNMKIIWRENITCMPVWFKLKAGVAGQPTIHKKDQLVGETTSKRPNRMYKEMCFPLQLHTTCLTCVGKYLIPFLSSDYSHILEIYYINSWQNMPDMLDMSGRQRHWTLSGFQVGARGRGWKAQPCLFTVSNKLWRTDRQTDWRRVNW